MTTSVGTDCPIRPFPRNETASAPRCSTSSLSARHSKSGGFVCATIATRGLTSRCSPRWSSVSGTPRTTRRTSSEISRWARSKWSTASFTTRASTGRGGITSPTSRVPSRSLVSTPSAMSSSVPAGDGTHRWRSSGAVPSTRWRTGGHRSGPTTSGSRWRRRRRATSFSSSATRRTPPMRSLTRPGPRPSTRPESDP